MKHNTEGTKNTKATNQPETRQASYTQFVIRNTIRFVRSAYFLSGNSNT